MSTCLIESANFYAFNLSVPVEDAFAPGDYLSERSDQRRREQRSPCEKLVRVLQFYLKNDHPNENDPRNPEEQDSRPHIACLATDVRATHAQAIE
ncbi:hypothetical protein [Kocuria sp.]|uniref:hypothetical protein n=1 Tax=Kocuria sp. TaxID=1871328 RepID=UPI0026DFC2D9|nr:hypothetical protein [Kocuria sp.]MDO5619514.1 hypothetical protein [Kocuria sp.]